MALDAICLGAVLDELRPQLVGSRIDKIQQPARDQVVLVLRGNRRLLLCASPNQPRLHITEHLRDNPSQPPMFCMLLRKHLANGRIVAVEQAPMERVVSLAIESMDELGEMSVYKLILEVMGRRANLILCGADGRVLDCLRRVDFEMSPDRQVMPGLFYHLPPAPDKCDPLGVSREEFLSRLPVDTPLDGWLVDTFNAISPLIAREIVSRAYDATDLRHGDARLWEAFADWRDGVQSGAFLPVVVERNGKPADFTYTPISQYGEYAVSHICESFSSLLDTFYVEREQAERVKQKGQEMTKAVTNGISRLRRKMAMQTKELAQTKEREHLRLCGELLTANFYRMQRGQTSVTVENYYEPDCPPMEIKLDGRLTPQENANRYFKQYAKAKTAEKILGEQLEKGAVELEYLESVAQELQQAESEQDFNDIRAELIEAGYLRRQGKKGGGFNRPSKPREFRSSAGLRILVGRNNVQNDKLTTKTAQKWDMWLHTQKIHGSHVILCTDGVEVDERSIEEAAILAAYYSQGREAGRVDVDYTPVKFVKKPAGSRPGMVVYTTYKTITVKPDGEVVKRLSVK